MRRLKDAVERSNASTTRLNGRILALTWAIAIMTLVMTVIALVQAAK
jgi:hypothetical protein